ncbi:MAG: hypothetical protein ACOYL6_07690 [Bacteriovoracaceae bacterium]
MFKKILGLILITCCSQIWALVPIEGALLGKVNEDFQKDPLDLVFSKKQSEGFIQNRHELRLFSGFILEGERLAGSCSAQDKIYYSEAWKERTAVASIASTLQYVGLDLTTRAIGKYAKLLDFSDDDFGHLTDRLVGNYCSKNLSVISLKNLKENLLKRFETENEFNLPTTAGNLLFPEEIKKSSESLKARENEFLTTIKLFRGFCSWDGDTNDFRLMTPMLRNPFIMAFVNRLMEGVNLSYNDDLKQLSKVKTNDTVKVLCRDLVCRPAEELEFNRNYPRAIGSPEISSDLNRIYCLRFRDLDYKMKEQEEHVKKWINNQTLEEEKFAQMQLIALITRIPDFLMGVTNYQDFIQVAKLGVDETWNNWALSSNQEFSHELYYEESLNISVVDRSFYYFFLNPSFKVQVDLSLGEFDKTTVLNDKIGFIYDLKLNKSYMRWVRNEYMNTTTNETAEVVIADMVNHLLPQIEKMQKSLMISPWNAGLPRLVAIELLEQFRLYQGNYFAELSTDDISIPLEFRYGVFALKYMNYRAKTKPLYEKSKKQQDSAQSGSSSAQNL